MDTIDEADLPAKMQELAVQKVHEIVHRQEFYQIRQDEGETVAKFVTILKSKATLCNYHTVLTEAKGQDDKVSYLNNMVEIQMIAGIYNPDHKVRILTEADKLPTFADKYNALVTMQTSETSTAQLIGGVALRKSDYKKMDDKEPPAQEPAPVTATAARKCSTCSGPVPPHNSDVPRLEKWRNFYCVKCHQIFLDKRKKKGDDPGGTAGVTAAKNLHENKGADVSAKRENSGKPKVSHSFGSREARKNDRKFVKNFRKANNNLARQHGEKDHNKVLVPNLEWVQGRFMA